MMQIYKDTTVVGFAKATEKTIRTMSQKLEELFQEIGKLKGDINQPILLEELFQEIGKLKGDINQQGIEIERLQEKKEE
jgi:regulator of replication initiation timing|tara:strand:+ start:294 stop:530 length:237 start_codon:yes stop_codon:yes gene_type:complete